MAEINSLIEFVPGTKAIASDVNSNFETLRTAYNNHETRVNSIEGCAIKKDGSVKMTNTLDLDNNLISNLANAQVSHQAVTLRQLHKAVPAGTIIYTSQGSAPDYYLKCNGAEVSRIAYSDLFNVIGEAFGAGDNSTTFNLPDLRGEFIRGFDDNRGIDTDRIFGSFQPDELKEHNHKQNPSTIYNIGSGFAGVTGQSTLSPEHFTENTGGIETRPRNIALLACIKY